MDHRYPEGYRFDDYLAARGDNWLDDDPLLQRWLTRSALSDEHMQLVRHFAAEAATTYQDVADVVEHRENLPRILDRDAFNQHTGEVWLPAETRRTLGAIHGSGIWKPTMSCRARYGIVYLLAQNGEFGVVCSMACTDGMSRALRALGKDERSRGVLQQLEQSTEDNWIHGAQFVTEIQGGSDAATNALRVKPLDDGLYALSGQKWFCSNLTADYWMLTAHWDPGAQDHRAIGLFCVPKLWEGKPNGYRIARLKDKLGTRALPTAEIDFDGAKGWAVGKLEAGLKNMVAIVLTTSRVYNTLASGAGIRRAAREARAYADFRQAFGVKLADHPLIAASLTNVAAAADRVSAGGFATVDAWLDALDNPEDVERKRWARVLVSLAKAMTARQGPPIIYEAMMVLGGNGIEERFCALPRLWRDAAILETWEGPYTLLLMQALGDLAKLGVAGNEDAFLRFGLGDHLDVTHVTELAAILKAPEERENVLRWADLAQRLYRCFENKSLAELSG